MRIYKNKNVYETALDRIRFLYDDFGRNVVVSMSGGKDSTTVLELALIVAREKNLLPVNVVWLDQELEFQATADYVKSVMYRPEVKPYWFQTPFNLVNATSAKNDNYFTMAWGDGVEWVREKDPIAIKEKVVKTERFYDMFPALLEWIYPNDKACYLTGLRTEESPNRFIGLTQKAKYKFITWSKISNSKLGQYVFHPIYDWSYKDVWKAIHDHNWEYNTHYNSMYQYGVPVHKMRVSNYHHEASVHAIFYLQEIEPETYAKATQRMSGIDTAGKAGKKDYFISTLPYMFKDWKDYRDYLLENITEDVKLREAFKARFKQMDEMYAGEISEKVLAKVQIQSIVTNDMDMVKLNSWESAPQNYNIRRKIQGKSWFEPTKKRKQ
jgi:predicted phosphoadenosine phosphosulfate sulfurtransferase